VIEPPAAMDEIVSGRDSALQCCMPSPGSAVATSACAHRLVRLPLVQIALQAALAKAQSAETAHRVSERNAVEIVLKLIELKKVQVRFSTHSPVAKSRGV
jgi:hypothetical protein